MDSKKLTGVVFLDLKKAFDTVDHALLLTKLRNYGIHGDELSWFTSYLTDRTQSVSLDNVTSDSMDIIIIWSPPGIHTGTIVVYIVH